MATILAVLLAGCAVQGRAYKSTPVAPTKGAIYLYRPYHSFDLAFGSGAFPTITCGNNSIALGPGRFYKFIVDPGLIRCSTYTEVTTSSEILAKAGETYYLRESLRMGFLAPHVRLILKNAEDAAPEIQECKEP